MDLTFTDQDILRMWHTGTPAAFVHEQSHRFEYMDCEPEDIHDGASPTELYGNGKNFHDLPIFMVWTEDRWLDAKIVRDYFRLQGRKAHILWDMGDTAGGLNPPAYCIWVSKEETL